MCKNVSSIRDPKCKRRTMDVINGEVRINVYNPIYWMNIVPPVPPAIPLARQNAMTPKQWDEIKRLIYTKNFFIPIPPKVVPTSSGNGSVFYDSGTYSTCSSGEWDIEKGRF